MGATLIYAKNKMTSKRECLELKGPGGRQMANMRIHSPTRRNLNTGETEWKRVDRVAR